jgi:hypothetical protein
MRQVSMNLMGPEVCYHATSSENKVHDLLLFSTRKPCWFWTFVDLMI